MGRRRIVPEVVQSSAMDCGPASLKAVLEGFGISVSYGRLREACQTAVDGTSIDTLEEVARQLGLDAKQVMIPADHLLLPEARALPALVVVRLPSGVTHFVVVWNRVGPFVQVMDPGTGRRWTLPGALLRELFIHSFPVPAEGWRQWAATEDFIGPLRARLADLGVSAERIAALLERALVDEGWQTLAAVDAATRMAEDLRKARAVRRGREAADLVERSVDGAVAGDDGAVPGGYWSVRPVVGDDPEVGGQLLLRGAVLVRFRGLRDEVTEEPATGEAGALPPELAAALTEEPAQPLVEFWRLLRADGLLAPAVLLGGLAVGALTVLLEVLLFRGLLDLGRVLGMPHQRVGAVAVLVLFLGLTVALDGSLSALVLRAGRRLELRLRLAFHRKIPRLADRYFHSRLSSDLAERAHSAHLLRRLPPVAARMVRLLWLVVLTTAGLVWLDPRSAPAAVTVALLSIALPVAAHRVLAERDLKVRTHAGALTRFFLDGMLGLMAVRCHGAEPAVRREHEGLLVEWCRAGLGLLRASLVVEAVLTASGYAMAAWLLFDHLGRVQETAMVLLYAFWALSLPAFGRQIAAAVRLLPAQRSIALRLLEPLGVPDETAGGDAKAAEVPEPAGAGVRLDGVWVVAGGHTILADVALEVEAGQHVAVVGRSGAGKSSLVGVLLGWHRPVAGTVLVDGRHLDATGLEHLRRHTAWIDPAVQVWNRSLIANLRYGNGSAGAISAVLERAGLYGVLERLPNGLQTALGEGGGLVSGGEGQRVRLGRAMLRPQVRLAILDEPFRGLDRSQRRELLAAARAHWADATLLCVTHDIADTQSFDTVVVVESGRVVEAGAPGELLADPASRYATMVAADERVRVELWGARRWRRLHLEDGRLTERARVEASG